MLFEAGRLYINHDRFDWHGYQYYYICQVSIEVVGVFFSIPYKKRCWPVSISIEVNNKSLTLKEQVWAFIK